MDSPFTLQIVLQTSKKSVLSSIKVDTTSADYHVFKMRFIISWQSVGLLSDMEAVVLLGRSYSIKVKRSDEFVDDKSIVFMDTRSTCEDERGGDFVDWRNNDFFD